MEHRCVVEASPYSRSATRCLWRRGASPLFQRLIHKAPADEAAPADVAAEAWDSSESRSSGYGGESGGVVVGSPRNIAVELRLGMAMGIPSSLCWDAVESRGRIFGSPSSSLFLCLHVLLLCGASLELAARCW